MLTIVLFIAIMLCVTAVVGAVGLRFMGDQTSAQESRLEALTGTSSANNVGSSSLLTSTLTDQQTPLEMFFMRFFDLKKLLEQAQAPIDRLQFIYITLACAGVGVLVCVLVSAIPMYVAPFAGFGAATIPYFAVAFKRKRRLAEFDRQLPDAMEVISRALRTGHSLAAGLHLAGEEMPDPISAEFTRCYEEQNFGIPLETALEQMTERVPNLDLRFFATAVILQRQTGGDLAEILDKIGALIRERFKIWGQLQALTGEGRLSGIVLLALPPVLFVVMYYLNAPYCMKLFEDELGQKMLMFATVMQIVGAIVIKKIVNIKV